MHTEREKGEGREPFRLGKERELLGVNWVGKLVSYNEIIGFNKNEMSLVREMKRYFGLNLDMIK